MRSRVYNYFTVFKHAFGRGPQVTQVSIPTRTISFKWASRFAVALALTFSLGLYKAIEDETIRNIRSLMNREINLLRNEYGQTTVYP